MARPAIATIWAAGALLNLGLYVHSIKPEAASLTRTTAQYVRTHEIKDAIARSDESLDTLLHTKGVDPKDVAPLKKELDVLHPYTYVLKGDMGHLATENLAKKMDALASKYDGNEVNLALSALDAVAAAFFLGMDEY